MVRKTRRSKKARQHSKFLKAQINPFQRSCYGVKVPDQNTAPSGTAFTYDENTLAVNLTNAVCHAFIPSLTSTVINSNNNIGASSWTWAASYGNTTAAARNSSLQADFALIRCAAHGIRITSPLSVNTATGYCHVALYSPNTVEGTTWNLPTTISQLTTLPFYKRISIQQLITKPLTVVNRYIDQTAFDYRFPGYTFGDTGAGTFNNSAYNGWMVILVACEGQPSGTNAIVVENIQHWEGQPKFDTIEDASPAEPADMLLIQEVANASAQVDPVFESAAGTPPSRSSEFLSLMESSGLDMLDTIMDFVPGGSTVRKSVKAISTLAKNASRYKAKTTAARRERKAYKKNERRALMNL